MEFNCIGTHDGGLYFGDYGRAKLKQYLRENPDARFKLVPILPESKKQRGYFEGAIVPLIAFYSENYDYRNSDHLAEIREWLKLAFNGHMAVINGHAEKVAKSTKGREALGPFLNRVMDWLIENYEPPVEALEPENYKHWRDAIYMNGGPEDYISYLTETGILRYWDSAPMRDEKAPD